MNFIRRFLFNRRINKANAAEAFVAYRDMDKAELIERLMLFSEFVQNMTIQRYYMDREWERRDKAFRRRTSTMASQPQTRPSVADVLKERGGGYVR